MGSNPTLSATPFIFLHLQSVVSIKDRAEVVDRARRKALELEANRAGIETVQEIGSGKGPTVTEAVASYLKDIEAFGKCLHKLHLKIGSIFEVLLEFRELRFQGFFELLDIGRIGIPQFLDFLG